MQHSWFGIVLKYKSGKSTLGQSCSVIIIHPRHSSWVDATCKITSNNMIGEYPVYYTNMAAFWMPYRVLWEWGKWYGTRRSRVSISFSKLPWNRYGMKDGAIFVLLYHNFTIRWNFNKSFKYVYIVLPNHYDAHEGAWAAWPGLYITISDPYLLSTVVFSSA